SVSSDEITLSFSDTGTGMTSEIRKRIFEPFFTTKGVSGLGMGLSESYRIIERHGGRIDVETEPQSGSTFHIRLPVGNLVEHGGVLVSNQTAFGHARVLVIDDEEPVRSMLSAMLSEWGHAVVSASSADEGLRLMERESFDLVFTDLAMPRTDGVAAAAQIKEHSPNIPIVLMTGYGAEKASELAGNNVDFSLSKPFTTSEVLAVLKYFLN